MSEPLRAERNSQQRGELRIARSTQPFLKHAAVFLTAATILQMHILPARVNANPI